MIILIALVINLAISLMIASSVKSREVSPSKVFWISFLLTPVLGMFIALMSRQLTPEEMKEKEIKSQENRGRSFAIGGLVVFLILLIVVYYGLSRPGKLELREQQEREELEAREKITESQILDFKNSGRDTTREFRAYFSDYHALSPEEKEEFINHNKLPVRMSESEIEKMKYEIIRNICQEELPQYIKRTRKRLN